MNILLTGASRGIGRAIVSSFCRDGDHSFFLISRDEKSLLRLKEECLTINPHCRFFIYSSDLGNSADLEFSIDKIKKDTDVLDILINNAGSLINRSYTDLSDAEMREMFEVNYFAPAILTRNMIPLLKKSNKARVINIGSMGGYQGSLKFPGLSHYSASKSALAVLTECLAEEFKSSDILFTCLALGAVQTEMFTEAFPNAKAPVSPEEMADYIVNFAQTLQKDMNGKIIPVLLK